MAIAMACAARGSGWRSPSSASWDQVRPAHRIFGLIENSPPQHPLDRAFGAELRIHHEGYRLVLACQGGGGK